MLSSLFTNLVLCFVLLFNCRQSGEKNWSRGGDGVLVVALREVVNLRMEGVNSDGVARQARHILGEKSKKKNRAEK
ncbi:hypothetical protein M0R45_006792 [Rubus argutus]|uniref:Secreted protein n=1 Tax=Rubus argutus TaxID=59490 RepID=A0AAW1YRX2_RUBAR